jgi:nucleosome binding factor SPN SPT16 subunit
MADAVFNADEVAARVKKLRAHWLAAQADAKTWKGAHALVVVHGKRNMTNPNAKPLLFQRYLLTIEPPLTIMAITPTHLIVVTSPKKAEHFSALEGAFAAGGAGALKIIHKVKGEDNYGANFAELLSACKAVDGGVTKIGTFVKSVAEGGFATAWGEALSAAAETEVVDISAAFNTATACKEPAEQDSVKTASVLAAKVMNKLKGSFMECVGTGASLKHSALSEKYNGILESPFDALELSRDELREDDFESCYAPTVQSGGEYTTTQLGAESNDTDVKGDVLIASLGARYKGYCAHITRTYFINPTEQAKRVYKVLTEVQDVIIKALKPGAELRGVHAEALQFIQDQAPDLKEYFCKSFGFGIGLGLRDSSHVISHKCTRKVAENMTFVVQASFQDIPAELTLVEKRKKAEGARALKTLSCALSDTVVVLPGFSDGTHPGAQPWTQKKAKRAFNKVSQDLKSDDDDDDESEEEEVAASSSSSSRSSSRGTRRSSRIDHEAMELQKQKLAELERKQAAVLERKRKRALAEARKRASMGDSGRSSELTEEEKTVEAFKSSSEFPRSATSTPPKIFPDVDHDCVFFPINGMSVPMHISTIKSCTLQEERTVAYLRVNFYFPGDSGAKASTPAIQHALSEFGEQKVFVRELYYRSTDVRALKDHLRDIRQQIKDFRQRMRQHEEAKDIIEQVSLRKWPNDGSKGRLEQLKDISMRPKLGRGRRTNGVLQMHLNGLRFRCDQTRTNVDVIYTNIKHFVFQKTDKASHVVMIHVHLKHPILVNKKKCKDVSFYTEAVELSSALNRSRNSMYDPDEMEEEHREKKMRRLLNKNLLNFCRKVQKHVEQSSQKGTSFHVETPYAELAFSGTPNKEMVRLQPTVDSLINVTQTPPFVVTLSDIEHVHLEGVMGNKKSFDMSIIMKDKTTWHRISAINMKELGTIREWLTDIGQTCTHGSIAIRWPAILESVREIPVEEFWSEVDETGERKDIGWDFLNAEARVQSDDDEGEEDEESAFEIDSGDEESESEYDVSLDEEDSEDGLDSEAYSDEDDSDAGEDWEALDRKASAADKKRSRDGDDGGRSRSKRSRR